MNKVYNTEILSVGTELLLGHVTNIDARDISELLSQIGINVLYHTVVGDNPGRLEQCVKIAKERADIIITTGGLGPTCDDLTKEILVKTFGLKLVLDEAEFKVLYDYLTSRNRYTENNKKQVMLPEGCTVFHNTCGTAPGCAFEKDGTIVIMLPGPPKECMAMMKHSVIPYLRQLSDDTIVSHSVRVFGLGESHVDNIFADEMNSMINPTMAPYAKECDCLVQITAKAKSEEEAEAMCQPFIEHVKEKLGEFVYGVDMECVEESAFAALSEQGRTLAIAEISTGGELSKRFTDIINSEKVLKGSFVANGERAITGILGVSPDTIAQEGIVSAAVASEMAENVRLMLNTDLAVAVTGVIEKDKSDLPLGTTFVALATENETFVRALDLGTHRSRSYLRRMSGNHAFDMVRRFMAELPVLTVVR